MAEAWSTDPDASSPVAPPEYVERAGVEGEAVMRRLSHEGQRILQLAEDEARAGDSDHLGTEHVVLGTIAHDAGAASVFMRSVGITREVFLAQLYEEDGHAPERAIPLTPRSWMIVAFAGAVTDGPVGGLHLLQGVVAESNDWRVSVRPGPHHLRKACDAAGVAWTDFDRRLSQRLRQS
jgi:hypothetical protein